MIQARLLRRTLPRRWRTFPNVTVRIAAALCLAGAALGWPAELQAQLEARTAFIENVILDTDGSVIDQCAGDLQLDWIEGRRSAGGFVGVRQSTCYDPLENVQVSEDGAFEARMWAWAPVGVRTCSEDAPPCCLSPLRALDAEGNEVTGVACGGLTGNPSPMAVACGWDSRDFDWGEGCRAECYAELAAAGWPRQGATNTPGGYVGVTCCERSPLTAPRPLPADVGTCFATR